MESVFQDFQNEETRTTSLFSGDYRDQSARLAIVKQTASKSVDKVVIEVLKKQNASVSAETDGSIALLEAGARAVITGQQVGVLGGPLMTLYKILTAVKSAHLLSTESAVPVVPIFWLQSEDHDFAEIAEAKFLNSSENIVNFKIESLQAFSGDCVGNLVLDQVSEENLNKLLHELAPPSLHETIAEQLKVAYRSEKSLSDAFKQLWQSLCAPLGIIFFDPNTEEIKALVRPLIIRCFTEHAQISALLEQRSVLLTENGFEVQVKVRSDSPLWFFSNEGKRERGKIIDEKFCGNTFAIEYSEMPELISQKPWLFSSSALVRPIFQDYLFPTVGYVCGASEFNYWAQIQPLYEHFGIIQPLLIPRASFLLVEEKYKKLLTKSGFSLADAFRSKEQIISEKLRASSSDDGQVFSFLNKTWDSEFTHLEAHFKQVDRNLLGPLEQTKRELSSLFKRLLARYERSLLGKQENGINQLTRVQSTLLPEGVPQERLLSSLGYLLKYGQGFIDQLLVEINPFTAFKQQVIYLDQLGIFQKLDKE